MTLPSLVGEEQQVFREDSRLTEIFLTGAPFDTGTSYRPGARFGPSGIRQGSRRLNL